MEAAGEPRTSFRFADLPPDALRSVFSAVLSDGTPTAEQQASRQRQPSSQAGRWPAAVALAAATGGSPALLTFLTAARGAAARCHQALVCAAPNLPCLGSRDARRGDSCLHVCRLRMPAAECRPADSALLLTRPRTIACPARRACRCLRWKFGRPLPPAWPGWRGWACVAQCSAAAHPHTWMSPAAPATAIPTLALREPQPEGASGPRPAAPTGGAAARRACPALPSGQAARTMRCFGTWREWSC